MVTIAPERLSWLSNQNLQDQAAEAHLCFEKWVQIDYDNWEQKRLHKVQFLYNFTILWGLMALRNHQERKNEVLSKHFVQSNVYYIMFILDY